MPPSDKHSTQWPTCPGCGVVFPHPYDPVDRDCDCPWWCAPCLRKIRSAA